jgi:lysophospholipase L1-like esterase
MSAAAARRSVALLVGALLCAVAPGCSAGGGSGSGEPAAASSPARSTEDAAGLRLVSLGDSDATGEGDEEGTGWVQRYADLVAEQTGMHVEVVAHAREGQTSDELLADARGNQSLRDDISGADIVVIGAGGADLNAGDDAWDAGTCSGTACYEPALAAYGSNIAELAAVVAELRADRPTVFRAITLPNVLPGAEDVLPPFLVPDATEVGLFQTRSLRESTCSALRAHGGDCIDALTAFNGPDGTQDAYASGLLNHDHCCYPSAKGQQLLAELLVQTGIEPQTLS